ncbi:hypothetical protein EAS54_31740 [Bradyrhizobium guangzhouense]|nr:hypothetical protein EAS54_31740 [Bradyrhizobium guangzhouense]
MHGVVSAKGHFSGIPFDSLPILIRLDAIPNLRIAATKSSLVRHPKTPSSAHAKRVPRQLA